MKAAAVDYVRPKTLGEALALLGRGDGEVRVMAGGQSLVAMMNLRLANPGLLIDIARLPELLAVDEDAASVMLGACVTHAAIEDGAVPDPSNGLMPRVAATLAYRAVRTRGTLGGSLALADPAAEWPAVLAALDAEAIVDGPGGRRTVACAGFVTGIYETRLAAGEMLRGIRIPRLSARARWGYVKLARKSGEFALSVAAVVVDPDRGVARAVLGAAGDAPLMLDAVSRCCATAGVDAAVLDAAIAADLAGHGFDEFEQGLHAASLRRAARQALA
ncbi:MAG TPA: FAD binding domain-containing protein [Stellaceae bacterium]|nr:FAD binding domain-containing protein [Stellaceae bacterium]